MGALNDLAKSIHEENKTWWHNPKTGERLHRNTGEMLMLVVSELAEAMEGHRKGLPDDHLPDFPMFEVELCDALIRIFDMAGAANIDLDLILNAKRAFNRNRPDHKPAARLAPGGKQY